MSTKKELARRELARRELARRETGYKTEDLSSKAIPQFTKALYENLPFGKRIVSMLPNSDKIENLQKVMPEPTGVAGKTGNVLGSVIADAPVLAPTLGASGAIPISSNILKTSIGLGAFEGIKAKGQNRPVVPSVAGGLATGAIFGTLGKIGATAMPKKIPGAERIGSAIGGAVAGAVLSPEGKRVEGALKGAGIMLLSPASRANGKRLGKQKVEQIRAEYKKYKVKQQAKYVEEVSKAFPAEGVEGSQGIKSLETLMQEKGIMRSDGKINSSLKPHESALVKAYNRITEKYANSKGGMLKGKDIMQEARMIRGNVPKKAKSVHAEKAQAQADFLEAFANDETLNSLATANTKYKLFKNQEALVDKHFDLQGNPLDTARGETSLRLLFEPGQSDAGKIIKQELGVGLRGAKVRSALDVLLRQVPFTRFGMPRGR